VQQYSFLNSEAVRVAAVASKALYPPVNDVETHSPVGSLPGGGGRSKQGGQGGDDASGSAAAAAAAAVMLLKSSLKHMVAFGCSPRVLLDTAWEATAGGADADEGQTPIEATAGQLPRLPVSGTAAVAAAFEELLGSCLKVREAVCLLYAE
jgi:hypothetical protein